MRRIVRFTGPHAGLIYKSMHEAVGIFKAGAREGIASAAYQKLIDIGVRTGEDKGPLSLGTYELNGVPDVELLESEKDVVVEAVQALAMPTFAIPFKKAMLDALLNAEKVEGD